MNTANQKDQKKSNGRSIRLCLILMMLAILTFTMSLGTIARYSTSGGNTESARVAKFGVTLTASDNSMFHTEYETANGIITVKSSTGDKIVAPGTKDGGITFTVKGSPEVRTQLVLSLKAEDDIFYRVNLTEEYKPVIFTLKKGDNVIAKGSISDIEASLTNQVVAYAPNETINTTYTLSWEWPYHVDEDSDNADTILGDLAAGLNTGIPADDYCLKVGYTISIAVYQVET